MPSHLAERVAAPLNLVTKDADRGVPRLPEGWRVGWDCDIGGSPGHPVRVPLVVLHPAFGVALLGSGEAPRTPTRSSGGGWPRRGSAPYSPGTFRS